MRTLTTLKVWLVAIGLCVSFSERVWLFDDKYGLY